MAVQAFTRVSSLQEARQNLMDAIQETGRELAAISMEIEKQTKVSFGGIDFSLAPFPSAQQSLGTAMQQLGVPVLGNHGSLAAAAILPDR